jgi:hypothetical protein
VSKETAAAILVQTIFQSNDSLRREINDDEKKVSGQPGTAAQFLEPYYKAMLNMIEKVEDPPLSAKPDWPK